MNKERLSKLQRKILAVLSQPRILKYTGASLKHKGKKWIEYSELKIKDIIISVEGLQKPEWKEVCYYNPFKMKKQKYHSSLYDFYNGEMIYSQGTIYGIWPENEVIENNAKFAIANKRAGLQYARYSRCIKLLQKRGLIWDNTGYKKYCLSNLGRNYCSGKLNNKKYSLALSNLTISQQAVRGCKRHEP